MTAYEFGRWIGALFIPAFCALATGACLIWLIVAVRKRRSPVVPIILTCLGGLSTLVFAVAAVAYLSKPAEVKTNAPMVFFVPFEQRGQKMSAVQEGFAAGYIRSTIQRIVSDKGYRVVGGVDAKKALKPLGLASEGACDRACITGIHEHLNAVYVMTTVTHPHGDSYDAKSTVFDASTAESVGTFSFSGSNGFELGTSFKDACDAVFEALPSASGSQDAE